MYRFQAQPDVQLIPEELLEPQPSGLVQPTPAQFESAAEAAEPLQSTPPSTPPRPRPVPAPLPLPAAGTRHRSQKSKEDARAPAGRGQHFADAVDLGPEYSFFLRTASAPPSQSRAAPAGTESTFERRTPQPPPQGPLPPPPHLSPRTARVRTMPSVDYDYGPQGSRTLPNTANAFKDEDDAAAALAGGGEPPHPLLPESFGSHAPARPRQRSTTLASEPRTDSDEPPEHLPKIEAGSTSPTAYPNWHVLADREVELAGLTDADRLDGVLADPASAASLREFAAHLPDPRATLLLSLYGDLLTFSNQATQLRLASSAISSSYFLANSPLRLSLNISQRGPVLAAVYRAATVGHGLTEPLQAIRREIAEQVLDVWVQESVTKQLIERLGLWQPGTGWTGRLVVEGAGPMARSDGLSESFCLTDPNSHDNTIVAASEGFSSVTGYPVAEIVGRNCRFLQGPGSSPTSVKKLRDALARGERITQTVFNYRRDGTPYYNLVCLNPLRDAHGKVCWILGGQTDVTVTMQQILPATSSTGQPHRFSFSSTVQDRLGKLRPDGGEGGFVFEPVATTSGAAAQDLRSLQGSSTSRPALETRPSSGTLGIYKQLGRSASHLSMGKMWKRGDKKAENPTKSNHSGESEEARKSSEVERATTSTSMVEAADEGGPFVPSNTYTKIALVDARSGQIVNATPELAKLVGLSRTSYGSLAGTALVQLLKAPITDSATTPKDPVVKEKTRRLRRNVEIAIEQGHAYRGFVRMKEQERLKFLGKATKSTKQSELRHAVLHLAPLKSASGEVTYFAAIFG